MTRRVRIGFPRKFERADPRLAKCPQKITIERCVVRNDRAAFDEIFDLRKKCPQFGRVLDVFIADAVRCERHRRDVAAGAHERAPAVFDHVAVGLDDSDFDDPIAERIESGRLEIDDGVAARSPFHCRQFAGSTCQVYGTQLGRLFLISPLISLTSSLISPMSPLSSVTSLLRLESWLSTPLKRSLTSSNRTATTSNRRLTSARSVPISPRSVPISPRTAPISVCKRFSA